VVLSQLGIALGAVVGGILVDTFGVAYLPILGAVFAVGALLMLPGMGRILRQDATK
jgi:predicted MFS family arabinose efflux permease